MSDRFTISIIDIVGDPIWVATEDGQKIYDRIVQVFSAHKRPVELSFKHHTVMITAFLNAAIGQLYNSDYSEEFLKENLHYADVTPEDEELIRRTIDNAKRYFANREAYDKAWDDVVEDKE